jgi:hypothetical protein
MKLPAVIFFSVASYLITAAFIFPSKKDSKWVSLFNGKNLDGWDTYLGPAFDASGNKTNEAPPGLNTDPQHIFTIVKEDGENCIRISGEHFGGISTVNQYADYHVRLMFKWGTLKWPPKKDKKRDSGLLYHAVGPHGADFGFWMRSQEFQIEEGNCGDYWGVAGGIQDVHALKKSDSEYVYTPSAEWHTFSATSTTGRRCIKGSDAEKPSGEWNLLDLYVHNDTSVHMINGKVMMVLYHSRQLESGKELPLTKGKLQIQSEGAEIFYKHIMMQPLEKIPSELLN